MKAYDMLAKVYDKLMYDIDYDGWAKYIDELLNRKNAAIFEAACGSGSISCALSLLGHRVVASDISHSMLEQSAHKARKSGCDIIFVQQDMRNIKVGNRVDAVVSACDGANYVDKEGLRQFACGAYNAVKKGGMLLFDMSTSAKLAAMHKQLYYDDSDDVTCIWQGEYDTDKKMLATEVTLFVREADVYKKYCETHLLFAHEVREVTEMLYGAGFENVSVYEFMTKKPYDKDTQRAQFVCSK